jgi:hypothetical protein
MDKKTFVNGAIKANKKGGADGVREYFAEKKVLVFLKKHIDVVRPFIEMLDANELTPSMTVTKISEALAMDAIDNPKSSSSAPSNVIVSILDSAGNVHLDDEDEEMVNGFETLDEAIHWAAVKVNKLHVGCYAIVEDTRMGKSNLEKIDSFKADRIINQKFGGKQFLDSKKFSGKKLGFECKSKPYKSSFSRG